ncbi:MAG TPA: molybdenum cofactor guanylyltransferase [Planctomycetota bacterium]|nr:molybdenum cofactor guanylyltransferase [Planctomycetota bacterium]
MKSDLACGILAGGAGTRLGGREKALIEVGGKPVLARLLDRLQPHFSEIVLSTNRPELFGWTGLACVPDRLTVRSPLAGLHGILSAIRAPKAFVIGCDMPGASLRLAERLAREDADVSLPVSPAGDEPLHAVYAATCIPAIEKAAGGGRWKMTDFLEHVRAIRVPAEPGKWTEGPLPPFFNLNTPEDLVQLERAYSLEGPSGR